MRIGKIAQLLEKMGCPPERCAAMATQLDRRARMDAARKRIPYEAALEYLIGLMTQGWAARTLAGGGPVGEGAQPKQ
jgi:hypothetical protein